MAKHHTTHPYNLPSNFPEEGTRLSLPRNRLTKTLVFRSKALGVIFFRCRYDSSAPWLDRWLRLKHRRPKPRLHGHEACNGPIPIRARLWQPCAPTLVGSTYIRDHCVRFERAPTSFARKPNQGGSECEAACHRTLSSCCRPDGDPPRRES